MNQDSLDDALEEARRGEERGVVVLYRAFNPVLVRYLRHHVRGQEEDVASEVWASAATALPRFEGDARGFRALLFTLARRRTVDYYRRRGRQPSVVEPSEVREPADVTDVEATVVSDLSAQDAIEALVKGLPSTQAEVVLLRVVGDLSVAEVAEILGVPPARCV